MAKTRFRCVPAGSFASDRYKPKPEHDWCAWQESNLLPLAPQRCASAAIARSYLGAALHCSIAKVNAPAAISVALSLAALLGVGCGAVSNRPSDAVSPATTSPSQLPTSDPTDSWKTYSSSEWGYSLKYPQDWLDLPNFGAPDTEKYFSNENVGSPLSLNDTGVFLAISVTGASGPLCSDHGLGNAVVERQDSLTIDGIPGTINVLNAQGFAEFIVNLQRNAYCYWFVYVFRSVATRDANEETVQLMLGKSFRFGQPTASPIAPYG